MSFNRRELIIKWIIKRFYKFKKSYNVNPDKIDGGIFNAFIDKNEEIICD